MHLNKSRLTKWIYASDLHGDMQQGDVVKELYEFTKKFKPDVKIFGGDLFDFRAIRRGASATERADSMALDVELGLDFLNNWRPHVFLRGNHDERLWDTAKYADDGLVRDHAQDGVRSITTKCKLIKCKMLPYNVNTGVYRLGKLSFIHGFHAGIFATKRHAEVFADQGGATIHGHTHSIQQCNIPRHGGATGYGAGCLCRLDMEYNRHFTARLSHEHGWCYGFATKNDFQVFQARKMGERCVYATAFNE
jgi:predicted phosphodiesterase